MSHTLTKFLNDCLCERNVTGISATELVELLTPHIAAKDDTIRDLTRELENRGRLLLEFEAKSRALRTFVESVAKQKPEKPDYWTECGQCRRNASDAEDLINP